MRTAIITIKSGTEASVSQKVDQVTITISAGRNVAIAESVDTIADAAIEAITEQATESGNQLLQITDAGVQAVSGAASAGSTLLNATAQEANTSIEEVKDQALEQLSQVAGGTISRSKVFYEITITTDLVFSFYAEHSGTVTKADGLTALKRNNDLVTVPFAIAKNDILTGTATAAGVYSMDVELADTVRPVSGFMGVEGSWNKSVSGFANCYNGFVTCAKSISLHSYSIIKLGTTELLDFDININVQSNYESNRIEGTPDFTVFTDLGKIHIIENLTKIKSTISAGAYPSILKIKNNVLLLNNFSTILILDLNTRLILSNVPIIGTMVCGDFVGLTAFYTYSNYWRSIRNGTLSSAYAIAGAFGVLCYSGYVYVTGTNIIIKANDQTDQIVASLALNGNARRILQIGEKLYCGTSTGWVYEIDIPTFAITRSVNTGIATGHDIVDIGGGYIILSSTDVNLAVRVKLSDFTWRSYLINVQPHRIHLDFPNGLIAFAKFSIGTDGLTNVYKLANFLTP